MFEYFVKWQGVRDVATANAMPDGPGKAEAVDRARRLRAWNHEDMSMQLLDLLIDANHIPLEKYFLTGPGAQMPPTLGRTAPGVGLAYLLTRRRTDGAGSCFFLHRRTRASAAVAFDHPTTLSTSQGAHVIAGSQGQAGIKPQAEFDAW